MPKFREWRTRSSSHGAAPELRSLRCKECRDWFQPSSSTSNEQVCPKCSNKRKPRSNRSEERADQTHFIAIRDRHNPAGTRTASPAPSSSSMFSPGLGPYSLYKRPTPEPASLRETSRGSQRTSRAHRVSSQVEKLPEVVDLADDDEVDATESRVSKNMPPKQSNRGFHFERINPVQLAYKAIKQEVIAASRTFGLESARPSTSFCPNASFITSHSREFSGISSGRRQVLESIGIQTDTTPPPPPQKDVAVQVELIPECLFNILHEQPEPSTSLEVLGGQEEVVHQFETEIASLSSDPSLLELVEIRTELLTGLEKLKSKLVTERSRLANKKRSMMAAAEEAKRQLNVINSTRKECEIIRDNIQVSDGLVFRDRHSVQHFEDQVALTKQQLLHETDREVADIRKSTLAKQERRLAQAKFDLQRHLQQRDSSRADLMDTEKYLRDKEDTFKLSWNRVKKDGCEWRASSAGLVAVEQEAAFIQLQVRNVEQKSAMKILDLIEKREALLNYKHQQLLRGLLLEKQHYAKLIIGDRIEQERSS